MLYESKKTRRTDEIAEPTRPSHLTRTSSISKPPISGGLGTEEERHYYLFVPSLQEYKKTRWTEITIDSLRRDLAIAEETISEFKDIISDLEAQQKVREMKRALEERVERSGGIAKAAAEKKSIGRAMLVGSSTVPAKRPPKMNKREREKFEKIEKLKKEQEEMLRDLDDILTDTGY